MNDLYVLVDSELNLIITPMMKLPSNWGNVCGLNLLSEEKISDLSWAGEKHLGWKKITDPNLNTVDVTEEWIGFQKANLKQMVSSKRKEMESAVLTFGEKRIKLSEKVKNSLTFKLSGSFNDTDTLIWKFMNGTYKVTYGELKGIRNSIDSYLQECFDIEHKLSIHIDMLEEKNELLNLNLSPNWPNTTR